MTMSERSKKKHIQEQICNALNESKWPQLYVLQRCDESKNVKRFQDTDTNTHKYTHAHSIQTRIQHSRIVYRTILYRIFLLLKQYAKWSIKMRKNYFATKSIREKYAIFSRSFPMINISGCLVAVAHSDALIFVCMCVYKRVQKSTRITTFRLSTGLFFKLWPKRKWLSAHKLIKVLAKQSTHQKKEKNEDRDDHGMYCEFSC